MNNKKVYLIGGAIGSYRTQNLVKFLLDKKFQVYYNDFNTNIFPGCKGIKRLFRVVFSILDEMIQMPLKIYNIILADYVVLTAMSQRKQFELKTAKILGKYVITDFYLSLYDTLVQDHKSINANSLYAKKILKKDKNAVEMANLVLFLNATEKKYYLDLLNLKKDEKHITIPLCVESKKACRLKYFKNRTNNIIFNICWWGSYIPLHGLDKIIEAACILNEKYKLKFHMHLFGTNENKSKPYKRKIEELKLSNLVTIHNDKTFNNGKLEPFLVENCSLAMGNFGDSEKSKHILGNKIIDSVAMKVPVLNGESTAPKEFFTDSTLFYSKNTPDSIAENIISISQLESDQVMAIVEKNFEVYCRYFSFEAYEENLRIVFDC